MDRERLRFALRAWRTWLRFPLISNVFMSTAGFKWRAAHFFPLPTARPTQQSTCKDKFAIAPDHLPQCVDVVCFGLCLWSNSVQCLSSFSASWLHLNFELHGGSCPEPFAVDGRCCKTTLPWIMGFVHLLGQDAIIILGRLWFAW
eukprot:s1099_g4.t1